MPKRKIDESIISQVITRRSLRNEKELQIKTEKAVVKLEREAPKSRNTGRAMKENVLLDKNKVLKPKRKLNSKQKAPKLSKLEIPVDRECTSKLNSAIVYVEDNDIYDTMLNQTNLQFNNNKFYLIQLLKDNDRDSFSVWMRWARVGKVGQTKLTSFGTNLQSAKDCFAKKFLDKTKNHWEDRSQFEKYDGKYDLVHIDYVKKDEDEEDSNKSVKTESSVKLETLECKLEDKLQDLLKIIFDVGAMDSAASELNYDADRLPLGRLTEDQLKAGYKALREVEGLLAEGRVGGKQLLMACNAYYTRIPHDFGMRIPPMIRSLGDIKKELELLETLGDIKIALNLMKMGDINVHPLDRQYKSLECSINPMDHHCDTFKLLNGYLTTTHGSTHTDYSLELMDLYEVKKEKEWDNFQDVGNKMLLWHGSRTTNYGGILSMGLRIAPPEAPVTGHMFGKGVYFSDMSSKSANYVYTSRSKNIGFLLLCEVSLGNCRELVRADAKAAKLPAGVNSVKGCGQIEPERSTWSTTEDGVVVPVGLPIDTGLSGRHKGYLLNYNEYIVYSTNQIRIRYIMKVRFNYK